MIELYPAIDLRGGKVVRLRQGDYADETVYGDDPVSVARGFADAGATWIHIVDLDAAKSGDPVNRPIIQSVARAVKSVAKVQTGGGVRSVADARQLADAGVARVVMGSAAVAEPSLVASASGVVPVAVGLDHRNGEVSVHGWTEGSGLQLDDAYELFPTAAVFVITDIGRDGMLEGPDVEGLTHSAEVAGAPVIASGGVADLADIERLAEIEGLGGIITGKALYEGRFTRGRRLGGAVVRTARVIPCLDVTAGRVVKGTNFVDLRDAGDPVELAARYDLEGADELVFLDITASSDNRQTTVDMVRSVADQVYIPFTVGGGIRALADARTMLQAGADKVSVNTAAVERPDLIAEIAGVFGNQCVVCAIDAKRRPADDGGGWEVYVHGGRTPTGIDAIEWAKRAVELGAGELLVTSMDRDGTRAGFDIELTRTIADAVNVPIIASGGVGTLDHLAEGVTAGGADGVLAASIFHFREHTVAEAKTVMTAAGIAVRPA